MKDNNISVRDYTFLNGIEAPNLLTPEIMEQTIVDNFEKGKITEELFLGSMNILEKGKSANMGEIREWSGKRYQKTANGWTPVKEGGKEYSDKDRKEANSAASAEQTLRARRVMDSDESTPEQKAKAKEFLDNKKAENDKAKKSGSESSKSESKDIDLHNAKENLERTKELYKHTPTQEKREEFEAAQKKHDSLTKD